jgi:hypothetical protein
MFFFSYVKQKKNRIGGGMKRNGLLYRLYFSDPKRTAFPSCSQIRDSTNHKKTLNFYSNIMWITQSSVFQRIHDGISKSLLIELIMKYTLIFVTHRCRPCQRTWSHSSSCYGSTVSATAWSTTGTDLLKWHAKQTANIPEFQRNPANDILIHAISFLESE